MLSNDSFAKYSWKVRNGVPVNVKGFDYTPELTKQDLIDKYNLKVEVTDDEIGYKVYQYSKKISDYRELKIVLSKYNSRYGKIRVYYNCWYYCPETRLMKLIALHRLIYVWYKGDIPKGYIVDHIDNNQLNNDPDNLQLLTRGENVKKNNNGNNQFTVTRNNPALYEECRKRLSESMRHLYASGNKKPHPGWGKEAKIRSIDRQIARLEEEIELLRYTSNWNHSEEFYQKKERNLRAKIEILQNKKNSLK